MNWGMHGDCRILMKFLATKVRPCHTLKFLSLKTDLTFSSLRINGASDLGNCMDYTRKFFWKLHHEFYFRSILIAIISDKPCVYFTQTDNEEKNKTPDESNYNFLFQLYGLVPGAEPYDPPTAAPTISPAPTMAPTIELVGTSEQIEPNDFAPGNNGKNDKGGKNGNRSLESSLSEEEMETMLVDARERIMSGSTKNVRLLHRGVRGEVHEADMANGHRLRVHKLLPVA